LLLDAENPLPNSVRDSWPPGKAIISMSGRVILQTRSLGWKKPAKFCEATYFCDISRCGPLLRFFWILSNYQGQVTSDGWPWIFGSFQGGRSRSTGKFKDRSRSSLENWRCCSDPILEIPPFNMGFSRSMHASIEIDPSEFLKMTPRSISIRSRSTESGIRWRSHPSLDCMLDARQSSGEFSCMFNYVLYCRRLV